MDEYQKRDQSVLDQRNTDQPNIEELHTDHPKNGYLIAKLCSRMLLFFGMVLIAAGGLKFIEASPIATQANQVNVTLDYLQETALVLPGTGNSTKFYFSKNKMKSWELIDPYGPIDISALLSSKEVSIYFKGNKDTVPAEVKLQAANSSLKAEYKVFNGEGRIMLLGASSPVEYRKGSYGQWSTVLNNMVVATPFEMNGATLYFRTQATKQLRAGKAITVKVPKKPTAPSVKLDGSRLNLSGLKAGQTQYRVGDSNIWLEFQSADSKIKTLDLKSLLGPALPVNVSIPAGTIEFRNKATDKKVASAVKVIEVSRQPVTPENLKLEGTNLTVFDNNKKNYYEYTIVSAGETIDLSKARWTSFTSTKPVVIKKAVIGDKIYVRLKATTDPTTKNVIPASTYKEFTVEYIIK